MLILTRELDPFPQGGIYLWEGKIFWCNKLHLLELKKKNLGHKLESFRGKLDRISFISASLILFLII